MKITKTHMRLFAFLLIIVACVGSYLFFLKQSKLVPLASESVQKDMIAIDNERLPNQKNAILVPTSKSADWRDFAYLAAIPSASLLNNGRPVVLALDEHATLRPETQDFLRRYKPDTTYVLDCFDKPHKATDGLVYWWRLDEGQGVQFESEIGNHTGTIHRLPVYDKKMGEGYKFNGQTVIVDQGTMPGSTRELTVAFWMKADKVDHQSVVSKLDNENKAPGWSVLLRNQKEQRSVRFRIGGGGDAWFHSDLAVSNAYKAGEWVHITCTHADGVSKIYLNGQLKGTRKGITWATVNNGNSPLNIDDYYGTIDELRIYDRAIDELEALRLPGESGATGKGLVGYWPMDEAKGKQTADRVNQNHLRLEGDPALVKGRVGGSVHLKSKEDRLILPSNSDSLKPLTVRFEFKSNEEQNCTILNKRGTGDQLPPWSFSLEQRTLVFRIGDKGAELRAVDVCEPGKTVSVKATYHARKMTLFVNGKLVASKDGVGWSVDNEPFQACRYDGVLDKIRVYDSPIDNSGGQIVQTPSATTDPGLIGSWLLDQGKNQAPLSCWTEGKYGSGLQFGEDSLYTECQMPSWNSDELTVAFWIKPLASGCILSRQSEKSGEPGWNITLEKDRQTLRFEVDGRSRRLDHHEAFRFGEWTHITCTYANGAMTLYRDGRWVQTLRGKEGARLKEIVAPLRMGALLPGEKHFKGVLDDVSIFNRAVSEKEARALYGATRLDKSIKPIAAKDAESTACTLAKKFWKLSDRVVCCSVDNYADALVASALAARIKAPLLFFNKNGYRAETKEAIRSLKAKEILLIGQNPPVFEEIKVTVLADHLEALGWMKENGIAVNYLAAVNPEDRTMGLVRKVSLAGPLLAAGREGAVAILDFETQWKLAFEGSKKHDKKVAGAPDSKAGWRTGTIDLDGKRYPFVLSSTDKSFFNRVSVQTGRKDYAGPFKITDTVDLNGRLYTIGFKKNALQLTWPGKDEIIGRLKACYQAMGHYPEYLCIMGRPDVIPQALVIKGWGHGDLPNDIPYAEADADPFSEIAVGRFVAEDLWSASLTASRGLVYRDLIDPSWTQSCATACWQKFMDPQFRDVGFSPTVHHAGTKLLDDTAAVRNVVAIRHGEHSSSMDIGKLVHWQSEVLVAPLILHTSGCSVMDLDADADGRSAPIRLLRNGAVAVFGNTNLGIAEGGHYHTEIWNALLSGKSVGQAHRYATNRVWLSVIEKGQEQSGKNYYQLYNCTLFGDPAVTMFLPETPKTKSAHTSLDGDIVSVTGPAKWWCYDQVPDPAWGCKTPTLLVVRGSGVGSEECWDQGKRCNAMTPYYTAEARTRQTVTKVEQIDTVPEPLGWTGRFWVDHHQDGSQSILWRVRFIDVDQAKDSIQKEVKTLRYKLTKQQ